MYIAGYLSSNTYKNLLNGRHASTDFLASMDFLTSADLLASADLGWAYLRPQRRISDEHHVVWGGGVPVDP